MNNKQDNKKKREFRLKAQMKENLLKRKMQFKIKQNFNNKSKTSSVDKETFNG